MRRRTSFLLFPAAGEVVPVHAEIFLPERIQPRPANFYLTEGHESEYYEGGFLSAGKKGYPLIISAPGVASPLGLRKPPYHKKEEKHRRKTDT